MSRRDFGLHAERASAEWECRVVGGDGRSGCELERRHPRRLLYPGPGLADHAAGLAHGAGAASGAPFLADSLARYGYLPNEANANGLPVGFTSAGPEGSEIAGMTCAACHTRQIEVDGVAYRIDGGPAIVDFQSFLADLDTAVGTVLATGPAFDAFAAKVLGGSATADDRTALRQAWSSGTCATTRS